MLRRLLPTNQHESNTDARAGQRDEPGFPLVQVLRLEAEFSGGLGALFPLTIQCSTAERLKVAS
jgi:hypothetical protein